MPQIQITKKSWSEKKEKKRKKELNKDCTSNLERSKIWFQGLLLKKKERNIHGPYLILPVSPLNFFAMLSTFYQCVYKSSHVLKGKKIIMVKNLFLFLDFDWEFKLVLRYVTLIKPQ